MEKLFMVSIIDNEIYINEPTGCNRLLKPSEVLECMTYIEKYIKEHTDQEIENLNIIKEQEYNSLYTQCIKKEKSSNAGYIYLLKCADKYKIGYSNNVERRIRQLDTRPFPLLLITKIYSDIAYDVEQAFHRTFKDFKVEGEWYQFNINISADLFSQIITKIQNNLKGNN